MLIMRGISGNVCTSMRVDASLSNPSIYTSYIHPLVDILSTYAIPLRFISNVLTRFSPSIFADPFVINLNWLPVSKSNLHFTASFQFFPSTNACNVSAATAPFDFTCMGGTDDSSKVFFIYHPWRHDNCLRNLSMNVFHSNP